MRHTVIIAEAGVNHNGSIENAYKLIDAAKDAGVDYVKFQTFKADKLVSRLAVKANYQAKNLGDDDESTQFEMLKKLELSQQDHERLIDYCKDREISFLSTGFDLESLQYLADIGIKLSKVPSGELTNLPYLIKAASLFEQFILSTGMANIDEIVRAVDVLKANGIDKKNIIVLHCNTEYPTPMTDVNLLAMLHIKRELGVEIGYSDHTLGIEVPIAAVTLGATVIEKHFTLDKDMEGPDHKASLNPAELKQMVSAIRNVELAISGSGFKEPSQSEKKNTDIARKSIHLNKELIENQVITENDLIMLRPGDGISPFDMAKVIGLKVAHNTAVNHKLTWSDLL